MIRVLFVCLGNICRSPMAEGVFQHLVTEAGLKDKIETDSAGTGHWHLGEAPHSGTRQMLKSKGIQYDHRARLLLREDLDSFNYILTMDEANWRDVQELGAGGAKVARFMDYAPHTGTTEVPDPYYNGRFGDVFLLVHEAAKGLLDAIRREHNL
jgi:protein-tyrosine phosphatase